MRTSVFLFLVFAFIAPANAVAEEPAPPPEAAKVKWPGGALSLGAGLQYELLGVQAALVLPHFEPFLALGVATSLGGMAGGLRSFLDATNRGAYIALSGGRLFVGSSFDVPNAWFGEMGGGFRFGVAPGFFGQLGGGIVFITTWYRDEPSDSGVGLDLDAAIGISF